MKDINEILNSFGVDREMIKKVLSAALEKGGDYADAFFQHSRYNQLILLDGKVNGTSSYIDFGVGIRVVSKDQTGYAYVEDINLNNMLKAARTASLIAQSDKQTAPIDLTEKTFAHNYYAIDTDRKAFEIQQKIPFLQNMNDRIFQLDKRVAKVQVFQSDESTQILFANSEGMLCSDDRPMNSIGAVCIMSDNGQTENGYVARSYRMGTELLKDELIETLAQEAVKNTAILFKAVKPKGGEMPVVMGAGGSGILLHEAIGHAFEADFNRKNTSIFSDKLHKKVCNEQINVIDDGTIINNRGSVNVDDEGIEGQKTYIVKEGILNSYLHDRISAHFYGVNPTGNGRRESFRYAPIPRMRATFMESGKATEEEIIHEVKNGIFASNFTNGQVQIGAGDFTFFVKNGYLIENGRLTQPIKDINIIGNGPQALADITMVGNNYKMDNGTWTCGKDGQSCPVTCGMPSALVSKLTVGGDI